ncbi:unnamed protein product [Periconia digitata]|uniref:AB hydrolase-1 domain-containing protein n=1 Tax=Periconia digitata TaxID=1303443 RepID=A0A9W4U6E1_9PLEO|nr:unnamed protein product [Periconia digitata]
MHSNTPLILFSFALITSSNALPYTPLAPPTPSPPSCKDLTLSITASALNWDLPPYPANATDVATLGRYLGQTVPASNFSSKPKIKVDGTWEISARYCEPSIKVKEREGEVVQLLLHGFLSNKLYWHGLDYPNPDYSTQYDYAAHATSQGYATLSIDNLGNGESSHPDPLKIVQFPLQQAIIRTIISSLRNGTLNPVNIPAKFEKVVMVGHSYGALHTRELSIVNPKGEDGGADAYILTSTALNPLGLSAIVSQATAGSASVFDTAPSSKDLPNGYMAGKLSAWETYLYPSVERGEVDEKVIEFEKREFAHTFTVGELASPKLNTTSEFEGPVLVMTGRNDVLVCSNGTIAGAAIADCGVGKEGIIAAMEKVYPRARFGVYVPDRTGHMLNFGYSAAETFGAAHMFLEENRL